MLNIVSISGKESHANAGAYCAPEHGVVAFSGSVCEDVREKDIKICAVCPGFVITDMVNDRGGLSWGRQSSPTTLSGLCFSC